jgi:hypothetical protein
MQEKEGRKIEQNRKEQEFYADNNFAQNPHQWGA